MHTEIQNKELWWKKVQLNETFKAKDNILLRFQIHKEVGHKFQILKTGCTIKYKELKHCFKILLI